MDARESHSALDSLTGYNVLGALRIRSDGMLVWLEIICKSILIQY